VKTTVSGFVFFVLCVLTLATCSDKGAAPTPRVTNDFHPLGPIKHQNRGMDFCRFGCPTDMFGYDEVEKLTASK
jgi:hypothetical protein